MSDFSYQIDEMLADQQALGYKARRAAAHGK